MRRPDRVVRSYEHRFYIKNGMRVWLSEPPPSVRQEMEHDASRLRNWHLIIEELNKE